MRGVKRGWMELLRGREGGMDEMDWEDLVEVERAEEDKVEGVERGENVVKLGRAKRRRLAGDGGPSTSYGAFEEQMDTYG